MEKLSFKCTESQLKMVLYGLVHLRKSTTISDVFLDKSSVADFNNLLDEVILDLNLSESDTKFFRSFIFKL